MDDHLVAPHGGRLVDLRAGSARAAELRAASRDWPSWDLTTSQLCDVELLVNGGFSPLTGFLGPADNDSVRQTGRLAGGAVWPVPIVLEVADDLGRSAKPGTSVALRDAEGTMVAALQVTDAWSPEAGGWRLGGPIEGVAPPAHYDFQSLRRTPADQRAEFVRLGWRRVAAYHPTDVMHRAEVEATIAACRQHGASLLIQAPGCTADGDHYTRVRAYQAVLPEYPEASAVLSLLPLGPAPSDTLLQAIVAKNHGCGLLLIGPDADEPDDLARQHSVELGVEVIRLPERHEPDSVESSSYPGVLAEVSKRHPPPARQGFTVFFTGLSGSGKSTIANVVVAKLLEMGGRPVTLLDGDLVRKHLSSELGFSKAHRDINIRRIGFVASEITKNGGIAICAPIAPYQAVREEVRRMIAPVGGFVLVAVDTSLEVCEARDRKGLYAKARAGILKEFTGISDPYEVPTDAEVVIDTARLSAEEAASEIIAYLEGEGFVEVPSPSS